jgi:hypothetical protein
MRPAGQRLVCGVTVFISTNDEPNFPAMFWTRFAALQHWDPVHTPVVRIGLDFAGWPIQTTVPVQYRT